jgi:hypothetical protein
MYKCDSRKAGKTTMGPNVVGLVGTEELGRHIGRSKGHFGKVKTEEQAIQHMKSEDSIDMRGHRFFGRTAEQEQEYTNASSSFCEKDNRADIAPSNIVFGNNRRAHQTHRLVKYPFW